MPTSAFGSRAVRSGFTEQYARSNGTLPLVRACSDGTRPMRIVDLYGAVSGRIANRTVQMYLGSSAVNLSVGVAAQANDTGWQNSSDWDVFGGTGVEYGYRNMSGSCYFARSSTSGASNTTGPNFGAPNFGAFTGSIGMDFAYVECPAAPSIATAVPNSDGTAITITVSAPSDNGGSSVTGYRVQRATNSSFTSGLATVDVNTGGSVTMTGLTPGALYYYRPTARNAITDAFGKLGGPWGGTVSATQAQAIGLGRTRSGTAFVESDGRIRIGSSWVELAGRQWSGSAWLDLGR